MNPPEPTPMIGGPTRLTVEHRTNPVGIDPARIRLSWWSADAREAEVQSAYQIQAASNAAQLEQDADLWDSGRVAGAERVGVVFGGTVPKVTAPVFWRVRTFDSDGEASAWSEPASFVPWPEDPFKRSQWISAPLAGNRSHGAGVPQFRRTFELVETPTAAYLAIAARGVARVALNGRSLDALAFAPGWSDYSQSVGARLVNVAECLAIGENRLDVFLGDGWFAGAVDGVSREHYGRQASFLAELRLCGADGQRTVAATDHDWQWRASPVLVSDLVKGESVDGRGQPADDWRAVHVAEPPGVPVEPIASAPLVAMERLSFSELLRPRPTSFQGRRVWRADLGGASFGQPSFKLNARQHDHLTVRYAADADDEGEPRFERSDDFTASGDAGEVFEPMFSLAGARFIEIETDAPRDAVQSAFFQQVGTNLTPVSGIDTDHPLLNRYFGHARASLDNVLLDVPVAGVGVYERVGDVSAQLPYLSGLPYVYDVSAYLAAAAERIARSEQLDWLPNVVPPVWVGLSPNSAINARRPEQSRGVIAPLALARLVWTSYRAYGDKLLLERCFPRLKALVEQLEADHADLVAPFAVEALTDERTPAELLGTALWFDLARLCTRMAGVLARLGDMEKFDKLAHRIRSAFRRRFVTPDGRLVGDSALGCTLALHLDLVEGPERAFSLERLASHIESAGYHACVPAVFADAVFEVLAREDRLDLAYAMFLQTSEPSWLHPVMSGERAAPHAHDASAIAFIMRHVVGLREEETLAEEGNAFRHVLVQPRPPLGERFAEGAPITEASAHYDSIHGRYSIGWTLAEAAFELSLQVPCGCEATVILPDGQTSRVGAGQHSFVMRQDGGDDGIPLLEDSLNQQ